jgi:hypothetical protein
MRADSYQDSYPFLSTWNSMSGYPGSYIFRKMLLGIFDILVCNALKVGSASED